MTEVDQTVTEPEPERDDEADRIHSISELNAKVDALAGRLEQLFTRKPSRDPAEAEQSRSVADEVKAELAKLKAAEKAKADREAERGKLAELEAKVKHVTERPPREYRKSTRFMGWLGEDDK